MGEVRSTERAGDGRQAECRVGEVRSTDRAGVPIDRLCNVMATNTFSLILHIVRGMMV